MFAKFVSYIGPVCLVTTVVKPADLLGLATRRTVHALECVEKQTGMHCTVAPARYRRAGGGVFTLYFSPHRTADGWFVVHQVLYSCILLY